jgi:hypothetical protein
MVLWLLAEQLRRVYLLYCTACKAGVKLLQDMQQNPAGQVHMTHTMCYCTYSTCDCRLSL